MKRGQATVFVILGIIIASIAVAGYAFRQEISAKASELGLIKAAALPPEFEEKQAEVENCLNSLLTEAVQTASLQGGYSGIAPQGSLMFGTLPIAYHFDEGKGKTPMKETVAEEIAELVNEDATKCATAIGAAEPKKATVKVTIKEPDVKAEIRMPVQVAVGEAAGTISEFEATTKANLNKVLSAAGEITAEQENDPQNLCLTCINEIATANDLEAELESYEGVLIATLIDDSLLIDGEPLKLMFAMRY